MCFVYDRHPVIEGNLLSAWVLILPFWSKSNCCFIQFVAKIFWFVKDDISQQKQRDKTDNWQKQQRKQVVAVGP